VVDGARPLLTGTAGWATALFSTTLALAIGSFLAVFMLYYVLVDWVELREWLARHLGVPAALGAQIIEDATDVVRRGIGVLTILGLIDAALIGVTMLLLDLPFVLGAMVVLFLGCYVPYLGTLIAGTFAVLIALGGGGPGDAVVVLIVILVVEIVVRTVIGNWLATDRLALRPLPSIVSSVFGVAVAGLLGAVLSAPALALAIAVSRRVRAARAGGTKATDDA
jgi:predicted PurR-regulated permease PerM